MYFWLKWNEVKDEELEDKLAESIGKRDPPSPRPVEVETNVDDS